MLQRIHFPPKTLSFTPEEITAAASKDALTWHRFVRRREFELLMELFPNQRFSLALELGAGDGGQSVTIALYCDQLICTEPAETTTAGTGLFVARNLSNVQYKLCNAEDLSQFPDDHFDLVFSSNMLEHVTNPHRCLRECGRVVRKNGWIVHTMPTRAWKIFNLGLHLLRHREIPAVHGVSPGHWREFVNFGAASWRKEFDRAGLKLVAAVGLPFYVGHGNTFLSVIRLGNRLRMSATIAYVLAK